MDVPRSRFAPLLVFLLGIGMLAIGWMQRYEIYDWWRLQDYVPPAEIVQLADETTATDYGRRLFYVHRPQLNDEISFRQNCTVTEASIVLGCYVSSEGIYLFNVQDERLAGVKQVTAAHEMLHAAYDRLGVRERRLIDGLTQQVFSQLSDERIKQSVEAYRQRDPGVVPNELHSILATEVAELPAELESHYSRYFSNRQKIVQYSQAYEAAFQERRDQVAAYDQELEQLKAQIDRATAELDSREASLRAGRAQLDSLLGARRYEEYNAAVPGFNAQVRSYNSLVASTQQLIGRYNSIVEARNSIALEENELIKAIDSRPTIETAE